MVAITQCVDQPITFGIYQRGDYWVMHNYMQANRQFSCSESITYTTFGDYSFLDNVIPVVERWRGPISFALFAPGDDFEPAVDSIRYLRDCSSPLIKEYVTFHMFFNDKYVPKQILQKEELINPYNCSREPPYINVNTTNMYARRMDIWFPINVGRNIAKEFSQTYFILAADIELYPSPGLVNNFLEMIAKNESILQGNRKAFALPPFEVESNQEVPPNKTELQAMLRNKTAVPFHKFVCPPCHNIPKSKEWQGANETQTLNVFHVAKRTGTFKNWEPFFIGTIYDPLHDDRLTWQGKRDKMTQIYIMCLLDYDFVILNNAFLVHKPGIKVHHSDPVRDAASAKTNSLFSSTILPQLTTFYGKREGCQI